MIPLLILPAASLAGDGTLLVSVHDRSAVEATVSRLGGSAWCWDGARLCVVDGLVPNDLRGTAGVTDIEADRPFLTVLAPTVAVPRRRSASDAAGTEDCPDLWELEAIGVADAWSITDGAGAVIAIEDSGFLSTHTDLAGKEAFSHDYGDGDSDAEVEYGVSVPGHGTFIAGMIAAVGDNGTGRAGVAPGARLAYQKIADQDGNLYFSYAIEAMAAVANGDTGARVVSYSLAGSSSTEAFDAAVTALGDADVLFVAAAANCPSPGCADADNDVTPMWPSNHPGDHVVAVASAMQDDSLNPYSHYGATTVDLVAPGDTLCSLGIDADDAVVTASGTSYATGIVAAIGAMVRQAHPDLTAAEAARILRASVTPVPSLAGKVASGGRVDARAVLATMPRLTVPDALVVDGEATLTVTITNVGGAGEGTIVLDHGPEVTVVAPDGWTATEIGAGESAPREGGDAVVDGTITLLEGPLAAGANTVAVGLLGEQDGAGTLRVRVVGHTDDVALGSPVEGDADASGAPAATVALTVTAGAGGCGCATGGVPSGLWLVGLALLVRRRDIRWQAR